TKRRRLQVGMMQLTRGYDIMMRLLGRFRSNQKVYQRLKEAFIALDGIGSVVVQQGHLPPAKGCPQLMCQCEQQRELWDGHVTLSVGTGQSQCPNLRACLGGDPHQQRDSMLHGFSAPAVSPGGSACLSTVYWLASATSQLSLNWRSTQERSMA